MELTIKQIQERWEELPENTRWVIMDAKIDEHVVTIGEKMSLSKRQMEQLSLEIFAVFLGFTEFNNFEKSLNESLSLSSWQVHQIVNTLKEQVFVKLTNENITETQNNNQENSVNKIAVKIESKMNPKFSSLPANVLEAVKNSNYQDELYKISEDNDLSIEQMGLLEEAIAESFLGEIQPTEFGKVIKSRLNLADEKVNLLVNQINEKILKQVRKKIMGENSTTDKTEAPLEINKTEKDVMQNAGFTLTPQTENKIRAFNTNDYKESYMQNAGIAVEKEKVVELKKEIPENSSDIMQKAGISVVDMPKNTNIFAQKLGSEVKTNTKETDHSLRNLSNQNNSAQKINTDPYRTPIE